MYDCWLVNEYISEVVPLSSSRDINGRSTVKSKDLFRYCRGTYDDFVCYDFFKLYNLGSLQCVTLKWKGL